jgi:hypothetical protein
MAFRDYKASGAKLPETTTNHSAPAMVPLSLELVPPSLCQSFAVPMHDPQAMQHVALEFGMQNAARHRPEYRFQPQNGYSGSCLNAAQQIQQMQMGFFSPFGQLAHIGMHGPASGLESQAVAASRMFQFSNTALPEQQPQPQPPKNVSPYPAISSQGFFGNQTPAVGEFGAPQMHPQGDQHRLDGLAKGLAVDGGFGRQSLVPVQGIEMPHLRPGALTCARDLFGCALTVSSATGADLCLGWILLSRI